MADNLDITQGTGTTIGADEISSVKYQRIKIIVGADGTNDGDVCTGNPMPISDAGGSVTVDGTVAVTNADLSTISGDTTSIDGKITACNTGAVVLAAGSAAIGKLAANSGVDIGDVDVTSLPAIVIAQNTGRVQGKVDNADTTTAREVIAAIASNYVYITSMIISVAVAGNYWLEDGDGTQITPKFYFPANGGLTWTAEGTTPYKTNTVNKAINIKGSIAGAVGVMLTGYQSTT